MTPEAVRALLAQVAAGHVAVEDALHRLRWAPVEEVGGDGEPDGEAGVPFARVDHHRALRQGYPEVVLCEGKSEAQVLEICDRIAARGAGFLATRADQTVRTSLAARHADAVLNDLGRTVRLPAEAQAEPFARRPTLLLTAGTGDVPVAEEASETLLALGHRVERLYDVGVAGIHRVLRETRLLSEAGVVIVVAGMEGALPSVVGGLVRAPVIAVPTSTGYGASFSGLAALLGMLNSCAAGVTVVNIDNGFGAAYAADRIQRVAREPDGS